MIASNTSSARFREIAMPNRRTLICTSLSALAATPFGTVNAMAADAPFATTAHGKGRGGDDGGIKIFKGMPYASARRFEAPMAPSSWTEVRDALAFGLCVPKT